MTEQPRRGGEARAKIAFTTLGTLVALASAALALVFSLWPALRPDPRNTRAAELAVFDVERGVSYGDFLRRAPGRPRTGIDPALRGQLVYVAARVQGFKRRSVTLRWSTYYADSRTRWHGQPLRDVPDFERTQEAPTDRFVQPVWVYPLHCPNRRFFVRVELIDGDGLILAIADSKPFRGLRPPPRLRSLCHSPDA